MCEASGRGAAATWASLNGAREWWEAPNASYMYLNRGDGLWWLDSGETGLGMYVAKAEGAGAGAGAAPPADGWRVMGDGKLPLPTVAVSSGGGEL